MKDDKISEFLESIDSEKWNCVYQAGGMTLLTIKEYNYRYEERMNLKAQLKKQKEIIDKAINGIKTNCIKNGNKYEEICCDGDYLLQILEDKEVSE